MSVRTNPRLRRAHRRPRASRHLRQGGYDRATPGFLLTSGAEVAVPRRSHLAPSDARLSLGVIGSFPPVSPCNSNIPNNIPNVTDVTVQSFIYYRCYHQTLYTIFDTVPSHRPRARSPSHSPAQTPWLGPRFPTLSASASLTWRGKTLPRGCRRPDQAVVANVGQDRDRRPDPGTLTRGWDDTTRDLSFPALPRRPGQYSDQPLIHATRKPASAQIASACPCMRHCDSSCQ